MNYTFENKILKWRSLNCKLTGVLRKQACLSTVERAHVHMVPRVTKITHLADISVLRKWEALFRGLRLFIWGNPVVFLCGQMKPCCSLYIMLYSLFFRNLTFLLHFKRCSCIQIKCGPLLYTCHNIDTGTAVSILVSSNLCDDTSSYRTQHY